MNIYKFNRVVFTIFPAAFMREIKVGFARYYNRRHGRKGYLLIDEKRIYL
jgi:hypothetical protein